jgi:glutamine---fructose-6-phosphate transaminase (isomerizing)
VSTSATHLEREIREQPAVLEELLIDRRGAAAGIGRALRRREIKYVLIAARGSSDNVARYAQYLIGERLHLPVALAAPSLESLYHAGAVPRSSDGLVIGISQSGRSPDVVSVLAAASERGTPTVAITNDAGSPLARFADYILELGAGPEESVAATKTYTASLAAVAALAVELTDEPRDRAALARLPSLVSQVLEEAFASVEARHDQMSARHVVVVGRGYNYATAMEIALKIRELTATVAEGFSAADLMHGPIAAVAADTAVIIVAPEGKALSSVLQAADALRARGSAPVMIAESPGADLVLPPAVPEWLSPVVTVAPGQVLALHCALSGGYSVDRPPALTKVTETL